MTEYDYWNPPGLVLPDPWEHPAVDPAHALAILPHDVGTSDRGLWLATRRTGIGGSDASALVGMNKYTSPIELWEEKRGTLPQHMADDDGDSEAALWGRLFEPVVRDEYARRQRLRIETAPTFRSVKWPWMMANPDGLVFAPSAADAGPLWAATGEGYEGKTAGHFLGTDWDDGQVADHAEAQAHWCMAVTGARGWHVACLIAGQRPAFRYVERDEEVIADLVDIAAEFWHDNVLGGAAPAADGSRATEAFLAERYPSFVGALAPVELDDWDADDIRGTYAGAQAEIKAAEAEKSRAQNRARQLIGESCHAVDTSGKVVATWNHTGKFDAGRFREDHPELAERFTKKIDVLDEHAVRKHDAALYTRYRSRVLLVKK